MGVGGKNVRGSPILQRRREDGREDRRHRTAFLDNPATPWRRQHHTCIGKVFFPSWDPLASLLTPLLINTRPARSSQEPSRFFTFTPPIALPPLLLRWCRGHRIEFREQLAFLREHRQRSRWRRAPLAQRRSARVSQSLAEQQGRRVFQTQTPHLLLSRRRRHGRGAARARERGGHREGVHDGLGRRFQKTDLGGRGLEGKKLVDWRGQLRGRERTRVRRRPHTRPLLNDSPHPASEKPLPYKIVIVKESADSIVLFTRRTYTSGLYL